MKTLIILMFLYHSFVFGQDIIHEKDYAYPAISSLDATLGTAAIGIPYGARWTNIKLRPLKRHIRGGRDYIKVRYYEPTQECNSNAPKKMVYLLTGIGGDVDGGHLNYYAYKLSSKCFYVLIFPSIFTEAFIRAASSTGIVGDPENDMRDFYHLVTYARDYIMRTRDIEFVQNSVMGYSLGGFSAAYMGKIDEELKELNLKSILVINSPVDLFKGMQLIDDYSKARHNIDFFRKLKIYLKFSKKARRYRRVHLDEGSYYRFTKKLSFLTTSEKKGLISVALSSNLAKMILCSEKTYSSLKGENQNIFPIKGNKRKWAKSLSFIDYFKEIVFGYHNEIGSIDLAALKKHNSLKYIQDYLSNASNVFVMHNKDDFLLENGDLDYLKDVFKDRMTIYPRGGHVGNLWYDQNFNRAVEILDTAI